MQAYGSDRGKSTGGIYQMGGAISPLPLATALFCMKMSHAHRWFISHKRRVSNAMAGGIGSASALGSEAVDKEFEFVPV